MRTAHFRRAADPLAVNPQGGNKCSRAREIALAKSYAVSPNQSEAVSGHQDRPTAANGALLIPGLFHQGAGPRTASQRRVLAALRAGASVVLASLRDECVSKPQRCAVRGGVPGLR